MYSDKDTLSRRQFLQMCHAKEMTQKLKVRLLFNCLAKPQSKITVCIFTFTYWQDPDSLLFEEFNTFPTPQ